MKPRQDPADVMRDAEQLEGWQTWEPGDGTSYRVKVHPVMGGPDHADRILLVSCVGKVAAVQYADPRAAAYRVEFWTRSRWTKERRNPDRHYDWWPVVIKPLLVAVGVARTGPAPRSEEIVLGRGGADHHEEPLASEKRRIVVDLTDIGSVL